VLPSLDLTGFLWFHLPCCEENIEEGVFEEMTAFERAKEQEVSS